LQSFLPAYCAGLTTFSGLTADVFLGFAMSQWFSVGAWLLFSAVLSVGSLAVGWWLSEQWFKHRHQNNKL
jgi:fluoride ion exporter CrcB/FEX